MEGSGAAGDGDKAILLPGRHRRDRAQLCEIHRAEGARIDRPGGREGHHEVATGAEALGAEQVLLDQGRAAGHHQWLQKPGEVDRKGLPRFSSRRRGREIDITH
ncbi:hypothetical protein Cni_G07716 [Canna indica]|uniref:Uncharacterized protein n=1 Tax=Canna indica TaxID=4628 RepID=A0AAQ3JYZ3_9LILI|nr:hypothetical protein Cni_G07716 [Canna indica]